MKTNMKLKSTLWALAFAVAAVSCSDDLEEGGGITPGNGQNAETAKINVAINTETITRAATKATPGENGDNNVGEVGDETEYAVNDVTLILYQQSTTATPATWDIKSDCKLVAAGWTDQIGVMENSGATTGSPIFPNSKMTTVEVAVKDGTPSLVGTSEKTYGVIAVTNLGATNGPDLVSKIAATSGYNTVADLDKELFKNQINGHVMSTHDIEGKAGNSQVTFTPNSDAIPAVSVYVERLSAKIRLSEYNNNSFKYSITPTMVETSTTESTLKDEIVLNSVAVVNQLTSGSFLLKRVSAELTNGETDLNTADNADDSDVIIGDEKGSAQVAATNFVIDPWTRKKTRPVGTMPSYSGTTPNVTLAYFNPFTESNFGTLYQAWENQEGHVVTISTANLDEQDDLFLCYTQENTSGINASVNGYSTGAIFKATYYPAQRMALVANEGDDKGAVKAETVTYMTTGTDNTKTAVDFYTYSANGKEMIFKDYDAILGYIIAKAGVEGVTYYSFTDATNTSFGENIAKLRDYANEDPFGYIAKMVAEYDKTQANPAGTTSYQAIDTYLDSFNPTGDDKTAFDARVKTYTKGVCYYPYWIKHADNGVDQGTGSVGVMEFGIVRNNIYDMEVTGISGLGYSSVDPTDPDNPDEDNSLKIQVNLYVKNWVVRSNDQITL